VFFDIVQSSWVLVSQIENPTWWHDDERAVSDPTSRRGIAAEMRIACPIKDNGPLGERPNLTSRTRNRPVSGTGASEGDALSISV